MDEYAVNTDFKCNYFGESVGTAENFTISRKSGNILFTY